MVDLKAFRKANHLTQIDLADYLGVGQGFISQMEKGDRPIPKDSISKLLANPNGWDVSMLASVTTGDNTIQVTGTNVDMRNINQSKNAGDEKRVKELEQRIGELTEDKRRLQEMVDRMQAQITKLLEKI
jgi:transcriptional regulator with XRE-family HTH domain